MVKIHYCQAQVLVLVHGPGQIQNLFSKRTSTDIIDQMMGPEAPRSQAPKLLNHSITLKTPYILSLTLKQLLHVSYPYW